MEARRWPQESALEPKLSLDDFCTKVNARGKDLYRDLPWRRTRDPYAVWVSEVMLQQTQVSRVDGRWQRWLGRFPTVKALASSEQADVLEEWQGMGYNRRALALQRAARIIAEGEGFPSDEKALLALPGIGPATAAGIRAFAFDLPGVYLETNVRTVFLHELFPTEVGVSDRALVPFVGAACPDDDARSWYYGLLDYGAWLKRTFPNPSRRSRAHARQSAFEGSHRQKRAAAVRLLLSARPLGIDAQRLADELSRTEELAGREGIDPAVAFELLEELAREGFCRKQGDRWSA